MPQPSLVRCLVVASLAAGTGCVGELDTTPAGGPDAAATTLGDDGGSPAPSRDDGGTPAVSPIDPADVIQEVQADLPFAQQTFNLQCVADFSAQEVPEDGIHSFAVSDGETLRFGKVADPTDPSRRALQFLVAAGDPSLHGGGQEVRRCELSWGRNVEFGRVYWVAYSVFVEDWGPLASNDDALFGSQMHQVNGSGCGDSPPWAITTYGDTNTGYVLHVMDSGGGSHRSPAAPYPPIRFGTWMDFVIRFKESVSSDGFVEVWQDGTRVASYSGSVGYACSPEHYMKFGYYNWSSTFYSQPPGTFRKVLLRSPILVEDPTGDRYSADQLAAYVDRH